ncbi:MAG: uroporphyrinogen-III synthase, partial [Deltaproteobacteria bacterium]
PFVFGRGGEEAEALAAAGLPFEIVPGVTTALGASAYAGIPLVRAGLASSVTFVNSASTPDWSRLASAGETLVIDTESEKLAGEMTALAAHGRASETPVAVIQSGTRADQRVVIGTVADVARGVENAQLGENLVVVVGAVVRLREKLRWWDNGPLFGRRVLVTRAKEQAGGLVDALAERGAEPVMFPAIAFAPPGDSARVDRAIREAHTYDLAVFTSANGVDRWFAAMRTHRRDARALARARVVAIGPATAAALEKHGIVADAVPTEHRGEAAAVTSLEQLASRGGPAGARVLLARAEVARDVLPDALRAAGAIVDVVAVYRTIPAEGRDVDALVSALRAGQIDAATFTSSSTVDHVCEALGSDAAGLLSPVAVATIGPITSATARTRGLHVSVEAATYTVDGLLAALERHYTRRETP